MSSANRKDCKAYVSRRRRAAARAKFAGKHPRSGGGEESVAKRQRHSEPVPDVVDVKQQAPPAAAAAKVKPPAAAAAAAAAEQDNDDKVNPAIAGAAAAAHASVAVASEPIVPSPKTALEVFEVNGDLTKIPGNTLVDIVCSKGKVPVSHVDSHDRIYLCKALEHILADWDIDVEWEIRYADQILTVPYARFLVFESISTLGMTDKTMFGALQRVTRVRRYWELKHLFAEAIVVTTHSRDIDEDEYVKTEEGRKLMNLLTAQVALAIARGTMYAHFDPSVDHTWTGPVSPSHSSSSPSYTATSPSYVPGSASAPANA